LQIYSSTADIFTTIRTSTNFGTPLKCTLISLGYTERAGKLCFGLLVKRCFINTNILCITQI